ncbi:MAG: CHASE3 domain-containing protein [Polaromonas sp.]|nr:CHASE3 domain-containing protein [Polaromonas sp.]
MPRLAVSLPLAVLAVFLLLFIEETTFQRSSSAIAEIEQEATTQQHIVMLTQQLLAAESGQRGFLLTGSARHLDAYDAALRSINTTLEVLRARLGPHVADMQELAALSRDVSRKLAELDQTVRMRQAVQGDSRKFVLPVDVGLDQMNLIREQTAKLSASSSHRSDLGEAQIERTLKLSRAGIPLMALLGLLAFYLYLRQSRDLLEAGLREQKALQGERDLLETQVRERTAILTELATHLQNVREDERGHLARELHDELGALLTAAKLDVARLKARLGKSLPEVSERLEHLIATLNTGIALKRRIVEDLRPSSLSHLGLVASLEILAREFEDQSGLVIATQLEAVEIGGAAQLTVYRLVQESLTNIGNYAEATRVDITLRNAEGFLHIDVKDNGKGFSPDRLGAGTHGLAGMRHRVEASGGSLTVTSAPGAGARIAAALPKDH